MPHIILSGDVHESALALLEARDDITYTKVAEGSGHSDTPPLTAHIAAADGLMVRAAAVDAPTIAAGNRLRVVSRHGVGYDGIDVPALTARGIPLMVAGHANAVTVAEQTFTLLLSLLKQVPQYDKAVRSGNYAVRNTMSMSDLMGKHMLIVGFGRIGARVARLAEAFGCRITVADPFVLRNSIEAVGYSYLEDFRDGLPAADIVTFHMPGAYGGTPVVGEREFALFKPGAILINCARGTLLDEEQLVARLQDGTLRGAGLDVTRQEPPAPDNPLLQLDNVILTPHAAAASIEAFARMGQTAVQNILDVLDGKPNPGNVINRDVLQPGQN